MKSNAEDHATVALCMVADAKVLVSSDQPQGKDYQQYVPQGKIYKSKSHAHLLASVTSP